MTKQDYDALTAGERSYLRDIERREHPACPGCGSEMTLSLQPTKLKGRPAWAAYYYCSENFGGCGGWSTRMARHPSVCVAAEDGWKISMRRITK